MRRLIIAGLAAAIASCGADPVQDNGAITNEAVNEPDSAAATANNATAAEMDAKPAALSGGNTAAPGPAAVIPATLRGRWGLTAEDCTSTRGDAKGRLDISGTQLRFYESRATLGDVVEVDSSRIVADFDYTGEGQTWQRRLILDGQDNGRTLVRSEAGSDAMPGLLRYRKCQV